MKKSTTRPIILLPLIVITFLLGLWQCSRLYTKNQIIQTQLTNQSAPAIAWYPNPSLNKNDRGKKFVITGQLFPDKTIYLLTLAPDESETRGYEAVMPFLTSDGEWLITSVGFYKERLKKNITSQAIERDIAPALSSLKGKPLTITVYADPIKPQGMFTPDNVSTSKIWFYINKQQLANIWQRPDFLSSKPSNQFLFKVANLQPLPVALQKNVTPQTGLVFFENGLSLPYNRHLEYIATWWLLAIFGFLLYWFGSGATSENKKKPTKKIKNK